MCGIFRMDIVNLTGTNWKICQKTKSPFFFSDSELPNKSFLFKKIKKISKNTTCLLFANEELSIFGQEKTRELPNGCKKFVWNGFGGWLLIRKKTQKKSGGVSLFFGISGKNKYIYFSVLFPNSITSLRSFFA